MTTSSPNYELKSDLARWSLVSRRSQADRRLAWVNSICVLFLFIGVVGARTREPIPKVPAPLEEAAPVIFEPAPPPPTETEKAPEQAEPEKAAPVVIVVPNAPSVSFSIPTVGSLVAPTALSQAPPPHELRERTPAPAVSSVLGNTGHFGDRPEPDYPKMAQDRGDQGTVVLLLTSDADGRILSVDLEKSSGSGILDRAAKEYVARHWRTPKSQEGGRFEAAITYLLTQNQ